MNLERRKQKPVKAFDRLQAAKKDTEIYNRNLEKSLQGRLYSQKTKMIQAKKNMSIDELLKSRVKNIEKLHNQTGKLQKLVPGEESLLLKPN